MAARVKAAMERLTGNRDDRLTTLQLAILQLENELKVEKDGRRKAETQKKLLIAAQDVLRLENQGMRSDGEAREQRLRRADERIASLEASLKEQLEEAARAAVSLTMTQLIVVAGSAGNNDELSCQKF
jgi:predicted component of type VI protein secretion system